MSTHTKPTQAAEILRFLEDHGSITPLDAMRFGCMRLAARIHELKRNGHAIDCDKSEGFARYSLAGVPA